MRKKGKSKNQKSSFVKSVLEVFAGAPYTAYNYKQISHALGIQDKASKQLVKNILVSLAKSEAITEIKNGKYKLNPKHITKNLPHSFITGIVDMKQTGKAYVITGEIGEDVFISANNTHHALDRDKVKVQLFPKRKGRKTEGQIVEIIERNRQKFVGIVEVSKNFAFLLPDSTSMPVDLFIPLSKLNGAKNGQKAIGVITEWPENSNNPFGEIVDVLGMPGDNDVEMYSILAEFDFPLSFSEKTEKEAAKIQNKVTVSEINNRRDLRQIFTCTIDPHDAKDFDDALSLQKLENGNWAVGVHIADVSYYVRPGSVIDQEAYDRGTSVYLVDRVIPMLPERLSNVVCSLRPEEEKLCFSIIFEISEDIKIVNQWFGKTVIKSNRRYTYEDVQKMIEGGEGDHKEKLLVLHNIASGLREQRFSKGAIAFKSQEVKFVLDETGKPLSTYIKEQKEANFLVEEFMLLANKKVAERIGIKKGKQKPKTFVYRIHDQPNVEKLNVFAEFVAKLGYTINTKSRKGIVNSFNKLFDDIAGKGEENMIETIAIRTMAKAVYSTKNIGHYGLSFKHYTHFTSPIRRYPDLLVHRLLFSYLTGGTSVCEQEYEEKCIHSSDRESRAVNAERTSVKYKQAEFLLDKIGFEFLGLISGVSKWGIYIEIKENRCEGMVSLKDLADDFYYLDEDNFCVIGQKHGNQYRLGDEVRIKVKKVDLASKRLDFELIQT